MRRIVGIFMFLSLSVASLLALPGYVPSGLNAGLFGLFGGKQQTPPGWMLRKQDISLAEIHLKPAERPCENWSWVAGITDMADAAGAHINQQYVIDRLYGGSVCLPSAGDMADLAQRISHDYVLEDGQKFRLEVQFNPGPPTQADPLIVAIRQNRPLMLVWRNRSYLLTGIAYDEYIAPTGNKMFMVKELRLFDPEAEEDKREQTFVRDRDNPDDLNGMLELSIYPK
jgi:hypothetical protein